MAEYFELFDSISNFIGKIPQSMWLLYLKVLLLSVVFYILRNHENKNIVKSNSFIYVYLFAIASVFTVLPHAMSRQNKTKKI
jgi:uncharacterized membrane protein YhaH (DUF805 family)